MLFIAYNQVADFEVAALGTSEIEARHLALARLEAMGADSEQVAGIKVKQIMVGEAVELN